MTEEKRATQAAGREDDQAVIDPKRSRLDPKIHDPAIFCPVDPLIRLAARIGKAKKSMKPFVPGRVYTIKYKGRHITLAGPAMGAPAASYLVERMIAGGAKHIIMLGLCGSINREVKIGDLVVPTKAWSEEGTSRHYYPKSRGGAPSDKALAAAVEALNEAGKSYHLGPVWTTDAVFRETKGKVKTYGEKGLLAVEMEASALFAVAKYREVDLSALLITSDELFDLRWRMGFTRPRFLSACRLACQAAMEAAYKLAPPEKDESSGEDIFDDLAKPGEEEKENVEKDEEEDGDES